jgi:vacuolar-type H+-ATPase subunit E/Vma4
LSFFIANSAFSNEVNKSRLRILKAQEDGVQLVLAKAKARLVEISKPGQKYQELLKKLILEVCGFCFVYSSIARFVDYFMFLCES